MVIFKKILTIYSVEFYYLIANTLSRSKFDGNLIIPDLPDDLPSSWNVLGHVRLTDVNVTQITLQQHQTSCRRFVHQSAARLFAHEIILRKASNV